MDMLGIVACPDAVSSFRRAVRLRSGEAGCARPPHLGGSRFIPRRIATLSVHTSPLHQPGTGDAGGMNVYIVEVSKRLAEAGVEVEVFTRATSRDLPPC